MKDVISKYFIPFMLVSTVFGATSSAQVNSLDNYSHLGLRIGSWSQGKEVAYYNGFGIENSAESKDLIVALTYGYYIEEHLSVNIALSMLAGEARSEIGFSGVSNSVSSVVSILIGVKYYFPESAYESPIKPYLTIGAGPFIAAVSKNETWPQLINDSYTLTSFGCSISGGLDFKLNERLLLGLNLGYNLMRDFPAPVNGIRNYSGISLDVGVGLLFGKGVRIMY